MTKKENKQKNKIKLTNVEIFWITLESIAFITGLVLLILGIVADYLPCKASDNLLLQSELALMARHSNNIGFRWFGFFFIIGSVIVSLITLNYYEKKHDKDADRELRRRQRLQIINDGKSNENL